MIERIQITIERTELGYPITEFIVDGVPMKCTELILHAQIGSVSGAYESYEYDENGAVKLNEDGTEILRSWHGIDVSEDRS